MGWWLCLGVGAAVSTESDLLGGSMSDTAGRTGRAWDLIPWYLHVAHLNQLLSQNEQHIFQSSHTTGLLKEPGHIQASSRSQVYGRVVCGLIKQLARKSKTRATPAWLRQDWSSLEVIRLHLTLSSSKGLSRREKL